MEGTRRAHPMPWTRPAKLLRCHPEPPESPAPRPRPGLSWEEWSCWLLSYTGRPGLALRPHIPPAFPHLCRQHECQPGAQSDLSAQIFPGAVGRTFPELQGPGRFLEAACDPSHGPQEAGASSERFLGWASQWLPTRSPHSLRHPGPPHRAPIPPPLNPQPLSEPPCLRTPSPHPTV